MTYFNTLGELDSRAALGAGISFGDHAQVCELLDLAVAAKGKMLDVGVALVGSGNPVGGSQQFVVGEDALNLNANRSGKTDRCAGPFLDLLLGCHFDFVTANRGYAI